MQLFTDWYDMVSGGRIKVEWVTRDRWVRMPGASSEFATRNSSSDGVVPKLGRDALAAADPEFDFSGVDVVNFILPFGQTILGESAQVFPENVENGGYVTNEGRITFFTVPGQYFEGPGKTYWSYWAHEIGHFLRMAHVGSSREWSDMHGYDLMGSQDGPFRTVSSWLRFVKGWLDPEQVYCQPLAKVTPTVVMLNPLDSRTSGVKSIIIPTSSKSAVIIESRRGSRFDSATSAPSAGVLVYTYDATKGNQETDWLKPVFPPSPFRYETLSGNRNLPPLTDALLKVGESVTAQGVKVTLVKSGQYDTVRVELG